MLAGLTSDLATPRLPWRERIALVGDLTRPDQQHHTAAGLQLGTASNRCTPVAVGTYDRA
ncbi:hypothetical protein [Nonomuraea sp. NPDC049141]|uniref:hypothetical protein n=1 Tax=Nonomuraea sp. NPDC049141 TaxID=3155500 RepID=UPI0033C06D5D